MKPMTRLPAAALCASLLAGAAGFGSPVVAQPTALQATPFIDALEVNADAGLLPGSTLDFRVRGTPRGDARVRLTGTAIDVPLRETAPGSYSGTYTVRRTDQLDAGALIRASLAAGGGSTSSDFSFPPSFSAQQQASPAAPTPPVAVQSPLPPAPQVRIDRFEAVPAARLEPGAQLRFAVDGEPGATVTVQWPGLEGALLLREVQPGRYEGRYTLRPGDRIGAGPVIATLSSGSRRVTAELATPLVTARSGAVPAAPGARANSMGAAAASALPLEVTSPGPNAVVEASQVVVQGRTAPGALVHVRVDAVPPAAPGRASVARAISQQTVQADSNGVFSVSFGQQAAPPGSRFEVQLSATQGGHASPEQRLVLYQRQG